MNLRTLAILILVPFTGLTAAAFVSDGSGGFAQAITHNLTSLQIWLDLVIAMLFWCGWVMRDARASGRSGLPWAIGALIVGAFAPLVYMIVQQRWPASAQPDAAAEPDQPTRRRSVAAVVFVLFAALTVAALYTDGTDVPGVVTRTLSNLQIWVDLVIVIVLWLAWMFKDCLRVGPFT